MSKKLKVRYLFIVAAAVVVLGFAIRQGARSPQPPQPSMRKTTSSLVGPTQIDGIYEFVSRTTTITSPHNNANNKALLLHEALHGYGGSLGGTSYFDDQLQKAFGLKVDRNNSKNITEYIKKHCF